MEPNEASIRLERLRSCIFRTMLALSVIDLSASSPEFAVKTIRDMAFKYVRRDWPDWPDDIIEEAAMHVAVCLQWMPYSAA